MSPDSSRRIVANPWLTIAACALLAASCGCSDPPPTELIVGSGGAGEVRLNEAERILARMVEAYAKTDTYADRGELRITGKQDGQPAEWKVPFSVILERPNKLRLQIYAGRFVGDGTTNWGWTENLPGYLLKRPASKVLTLGEVYADEVLRGDFTEAAAGDSLTLAMLLGADAMDLIRHQGERPEILNYDEVEGRRCDRIRIRRTDGDLIYWIDQETLTLRRMDFPVKRLAATLANPTPPTDLKMYAVFVDAQLNPQLPPETFRFEPPPGLKIVDKFDPVWGAPPPVPPSAVLGEKAGDLQLRGLDGRSIPRSEWAGKYTVLAFWSFSSSECTPLMEALNHVYAKYRDRNDVRFLAVSIDPAGEGGVADADLQKMIGDAHWDLPQSRDVENSALKALGVRAIPSVFLLDRDGVVQDNEVGLSPQLAERLSSRVADLVAGRQLVQAARDRYAEDLKKFEQAKQSQSIGGDAGALPHAKLAPKSSPKSLRLTELWKSTEVKRPGHVLVTAEKQGPPRIIVLDGLRTVAELDGKGKLVRTVALDLPKEPEAVVSFLRTAVDREGKRYFVGSLSAQQQLHLFDKDFKRLLSFPDGSHAGIADARIADIDGDGKLEICVAYWGVVGIQAVGLDGTRKWSNRRLPENVLSLALSGPDTSGKRLLLCTTGLLTVAILDELGETLKEMPVGARAARLVAAEDLNGDGTVELCAVTAAGPGADVAVGFDSAGRELWNYPLPPGVQPVPEMQNELVVGGKLFDDGQGVWVFVGADGTVHIVGADGQPIDSFGWGEAIRGIALGALDGRATLFLSDAKSVTALRLER